jgi:hypothetical protein
MWEEAATKKGRSDRADDFNMDKVDTTSPSCSPPPQGRNFTMQSFGVAAAEDHAFS